MGWAAEDSVGAVDSEVEGLAVGGSEAAGSAAGEDSEGEG